MRMLRKLARTARMEGLLDWFELILFIDHSNAFVRGAIRLLAELVRHLC